MDTITHGIVGALVGKALFAGRNESSRLRATQQASTLRFPTARVSIVACTLGSMFPDVDIFAGTLLHNPLAIMQWHRNLTHSLVLLPVWALLLAAISIPLARWFRWPRPSYPALAGIYAVGIATHIFLDVVTNFGTMVWSPLRFSRVAWDWLFILDLLLTAFALVPQLVAWCYREKEKFLLRATCIWVALALAAFGAHALAGFAGYPFSSAVIGVLCATFAGVLFVPKIRDRAFRWPRASWCRAGLALVCMYLAGAAVMHARAVAETKSFAAKHNLHAESLAAFPLPPTLTHWAGVIATPAGVWRTTFTLPGSEIEGMQLYANAVSDPYVAEAQKLGDVQMYLWFARFPIWSVRQINGQTTVEVSDVRFFRDDKPSADAAPGLSKRLAGVRSNSAGFTFQIVFDAERKVIFQGFKK